MAMDFLRRVVAEPQPPPATLQLTATPFTPHTAARSRDPNAPEYKYQVNQKCIYERRLPGGSFITAHLQRLQSGYYDTPVIHEDLIDNVRFVAINFVFHPSRSSFRFKSAEISVALHNVYTGGSNPLKNAADVIIGQVQPDRRHSHATQTDHDHADGAIVRHGDSAVPLKPTRPKFLRHAPHLLYGAVSPETLDWNFNVAGSIGVSQGPANASINPSGGVKTSYKLYEMMKIQGSVRTLRSWYHHQYDIEDGELVWTLEENRLQKSGLPREFTFVMLLTKGSSNMDDETIGDLTLDIDIKPKVAGFLGQGSFPDFITNLHKYQPFHYHPINLDREIGQKFGPIDHGRGFNFARLSGNFDDFVWLPGTTHSKSDDWAAQEKGLSSQPQDPNQFPQSPRKQPSRDLHAVPTPDNTLNLRVFLENARGSPAPSAAPVSYVHLRPPSRHHSPLPPASLSGSQRSHKRTITITSQKPETGNLQAQARHASDASAAGRRYSQYDRSSPKHDQPQRRQHSLRKTRSRSELNSEYNSSPIQEKAEFGRDATTTSPNPAGVQPEHDTRQRESKHHGEDAQDALEPYSGTDRTTEWRTPPETKAELQPSPRMRENGSRTRSRPTSNVYSDHAEGSGPTSYVKPDYFAHSYRDHASQATPEPAPPTNQAADAALTALPFPTTPPQPSHQRDISTSSSMDHATGVWNDSPPDWTSPAIAQARNVERSFSQRSGNMNATNSSTGSVRWRMIRYSHPTAGLEGRYYRDRTVPHWEGRDGRNGDENGDGEYTRDAENVV